LLKGRVTNEGRGEFELAGKLILVAGHGGMVGSAFVRRLAQEDCTILTMNRTDVDLLRQTEVDDWLGKANADVVVVAAAKVGGILANDTYPADFMYDNLMISTNIIHAAHVTNVEKLLFLGSSCIYPKLAPQPISEDALLTGPLEPTTQWYAMAKIAGALLCQAYRQQYGRDFIAALPTNLYGPGDNFDLESSHVVPALIAKAYSAKMAGADFLEVWGTGSPRREFLHVDDLADALVHLLKHYSGAEPINVGCGSDITIADLAGLVCEAVGFDGELRYLTEKPDGTPRKLLDVSRLTELGWSPKIGLREGLSSTFNWFIESQSQAAR
jgi:GDP-L-fucose synthase